MVSLPGRDPVTISADRIAAEADVPAGDVALRGSADRPAERIGHPAALSVRKLLALAGANPDGVGFLSVPRPRGGETHLRASDLADPPPFADGPPIVWVDGPVTHLLRPQRDDDDLNAADNVETTSGAPLSLTVRTGALLDVRASASPASGARAGDVITLSASAAGALDGETLTYTWHLDDGQVATGAVVSHAYAREGGYRPYVTVDGDAGSGGAADPITLSIGDAKPTGDPAKAPASGPASVTPIDGGGSATPGGSAGRGGSGSGEGGPGRGAQSTAAASPPAARAAGGDKSSACGTTCRRVAPARAQDDGGRDATATTPSPRQTQPHSAGAAPNEVHGTLLATTGPDVATALTSSPAGTATATPLAAARTPTGHTTPLGVAGGLAAVLTLLAAGAWREARRSAVPPVDEALRP